MDFIEEMLAQADRSWVDQAACRGLSPDLFHPVKGDSSTQIEAKAVCNGTLHVVKDPQTKKFHEIGQPPCPVKDQCLNYIMSLPASQDGCGVYGGLSHKQRQKLRSQTGRFARVRPRPRCGSLRGYAYHLKAKETPCDSCKEANAEYKRTSMARRKSIPLSVDQSAK